MDIGVDLPANLKKLIGLEPSMAQELNEAASLEELVQRIKAAARQHDIPLDENGLSDALQAIRPNGATGELTDEELSGVAGGRSIKPTSRLF